MLYHYRWLYWTSAPPSPIPPLLPPPPTGHLLPRPLRLQRRLRCPPRRPRSGAAVPFVLVSSKTMDALPTRCQPGLAPELRDLFPQEVVQVLDTAGLNKLMNFKLDGLGSRVLLFELMDCAVVDRINNTIEFRIREGDSLWVTKDILQHVLDLPTGCTKELLAPEDTEPADQEYNNMTKALKYVHDLNKLGDVDWAHLVHEQLMNGCEKKPSKKYFLGCVAVPLIVFVDCCKGNQLDAEKSGRINLYDEKMLITLVSQRICAPIVADGHISLVVVSHTESKIYFLDSYPDEHKEVADILVTNLQSCLQRHDIDISLYEKVTPEVKAQQNNCDCGFHVLLYVRGFDEKDIYNIDKEKVKLLRMELTKFLLHHPENRKNPKRRRISVHEDIPDEEEECELLGKSEEATLNSNSSGSSLGESFGFGASEGTGQEDSHENSSAESLPGHNSPNAVKNKGVPKGKKGTGTSKAASKDSSEGSAVKDKPVKPVTKGKGKASKRKVASEDSTGKSPVFCQGKRRLPFSGPMVSFKPHTSLSAASCLDIYDIIKAKTGNDAPVFSVGQTSIKAAKYFGVQNDDKFADVIKKELQELKNGAFRFLFFPTVHNEECIVFFVDVKVQDQVTIIQSSNSELTEHTADPIGLAFAKHVKQAFGPNSPISKLDDTLRVTQISYHVERKYSNLGSILALEHYSGKHCPRFQNNIEVNIASKLAHLIIHNENSAEKFPEVTVIVDNGQVNIRKQKRKAKNRTKKTNAK
ncbi:hypothetical protein D1007_56741 [Hordeum vulgare]|nr:hypothetical protein D1007_56741 [Hordeum vulgare]